jgi:uncharacterized cupredoxin-like copper-binding protein
VLVLVLLGACGGDDDSGTASDEPTTTEAASGDKPVAATLNEFTITLKPATAAAGEVHFELHNEGAIEHEFVVFKTDLDPAKLPVDADGNVDEEGAGVELQGEQEAINPGASPELSLSLDAGKYVVLCNVPTHYKAGMHAPLTVS